MLKLFVGIFLVTSVSVAYADCVYDSKNYGEGSSIRQADGQLYYCRSGSWVTNDPLPKLIKLKVATHGHGSTRHDVTLILSNLCDGKKECSFVANGALLGDIPGAAFPRDLWVAWSCGDYGQQQVGADDRTWKLSC